MQLDNVQHMAELVIAAAGGFGGAWARERYKRPKVSAEPPPSRREMSDLSVRVSAVERRTDVNEWDIRQSKADHKELSDTLKALVTGMQEAKVSLARIEERLEERA